MRLSSFSEGPLGLFTPTSHFWIVEALVFNTAASKTWLTCTISRSDSKPRDPPAAKTSFWHYKSAANRSNNLRLTADSANASGIKSLPVCRRP